MLSRILITAVIALTFVLASFRGSVLSASGIWSATACKTRRGGKLWFEGLISACSA